MLADFTGGKPPTSHRESEATLGLGSISSASQPGLLPEHTAGPGRMESLPAQCVWYLSHPSEFKICDCMDHTCLVHCWIPSA